MNVAFAVKHFPICVLDVLSISRNENIDAHVHESRRMNE